MDGKKQTKNEELDNNESRASDITQNSSPDSHVSLDNADSNKDSSHLNAGNNSDLAEIGKKQIGITMSPQLKDITKQFKNITKPTLVNQFSAIYPSLSPHPAFVNIRKIQSIVADTTQSTPALADMMKAQATIGETFKSTSALADIIKAQATIGETFKSTSALTDMLKAQATIGETFESNPAFIDAVKNQAKLNLGLSDDIKDHMKNISSLYSNPDVVKQMQNIQGSHFNTFKDLYDESTHASISDSLKAAAELKTYSFEDNLKGSAAFRNDTDLHVTAGLQTNHKIDTTNDKIETSNQILTEVGNALNKITYSVGSMEESALKMSAQNEQRSKSAQIESERQRKEDSKKYRVQNWFAIAAIFISGVIGAYQIYSSSITEKNLIEQLKQSNSHLQKIVAEQQSMMLQFDTVNQSIKETSLLSKEALELSKQSLTLTKDSYATIDSLQKNVSNENVTNQTSK